MECTNCYFLATEIIFIGSTRSDQLSWIFTNISFAKLLVCRLIVRDWGVKYYKYYKMIYGIFLRSLHRYSFYLSARNFIFPHHFKVYTGNSNFLFHFGQLDYLWIIKIWMSDKSKVLKFNRNYFLLLKVAELLSHKEKD